MNFVVKIKKLPMSKTYTTKLARIATVGPLLRSAETDEFDRRVVCYDVLAPDGTVYDRSSAYLSGYHALCGTIHLGRRFAMTYTMNARNEKIIQEIVYLNS